ncbi:MAG: dephospho-CoA kinase [Clostridiales bacterium]|nr:dephospho-CoA kinase [Clostridiales bacterium]
MTQNEAAVVIGVTGNSGSGKSLACEIAADFAARRLGLPCAIIDADKIGHGVLLKTSPAHAEVTELFGREILLPDGEIDRKKVARLVFSDRDKLRRHTEITHRYIIERMLAELESLRARGKRLIVMDVPLLIEAGLHKRCDRVWLIISPFETKSARITLRDNLSESEARARISSQRAEDELKPYADFVLENNGGVGELAVAVTDELSRTLL